MSCRILQFFRHSSFGSFLLSQVLHGEDIIVFSFQGIGPAINAVKESGTRRPPDLPLT
jgi:hypothetical protein